LASEPIGAARSALLLGGGLTDGSNRMRPPHDVIRDGWLQYRERALKAGLEIVYAHPVVSTLGQTMGFLSIYSREPSSSEGLRLQIFNKIAHLIAIALEREHSQETLRRLSKLILNAQENERRRLARELHDSVSQILSSVGFRIESVFAQIPRENQPVRQEVAKAKFLLTRAIHEVRSISENLRPSELDELGLVAAVRDLCEDFKERTQLNLDFEVPPDPPRFGSDVELALYRIVQEALTNIEKHAEASEVKLGLNWEERFVTLAISDNGKGLPDPKAGITKQRCGMGLIDMRERCAFLGGTFSIRSEPQLGTEIAARLPRKAEDANRVPD
jgi:signal transduction histidine kinase